MTAPPGSIVAYSASPGETADDGAGAHSPFVTALLPEITTVGADINSMLRNVRKAVYRDTGGKQTPREDVGLLDPFYFFPPGSKIPDLSNQSAASIVSAGAQIRECPACPAVAELNLESVRLEFAITEVTHGQWDACAAAGSCPQLELPDDATPDWPVTGISWEQAEAYARWLTRQSGYRWRLPTLDEWRLAAQHDGPGEAVSAGSALPVRQAKPGRSGLYGMAGNVAEWTSSCGQQEADGTCVFHVAAGRSWRSPQSSDLLVSNVYPTSGRGEALGFRVVKEMAK